MHCNELDVGDVRRPFHLSLLSILTVPEMQNVSNSAGSFKISNYCLIEVRVAARSYRCEMLLDFDKHSSDFPCVQV